MHVRVCLFVAVWAAVRACRPIASGVRRRGLFQLSFARQTSARFEQALQYDDTAWNMAGMEWNCMDDVMRGSTCTVTFVTDKESWLSSSSIETPEVHSRRLEQTARPIHRLLQLASD